MGKGVNPILPLWEYIPDGEPHVFGDRLYLFGSHEIEGGKRYCCAENYVGWSAPLSDPTNWEYAGVIYEAKQDPDYEAGVTCDMYAPDVVQGNDGRFYLYYNFGNSFCDKLRVAVSDSPNGKYEYLGYVRNPDGSVFNEYIVSDPAVINDDGVIRVYAGWSLSMVAAGAHAKGKGSEHEDRINPNAGGQMSGSQTGGGQRPQMPEPGSPMMKYALKPIYRMMFHKTDEQIDALEMPLMGANTFELEEDMLTVKDGLKRIVAGQFDTPKDSGFFGHAFYEASSIRKIEGKYYFIYSSENSNELCYAISDYPDKDFVYGGTIISNGDVGYKGRKAEDRLNMTANDHGSLECINGQWYIFHHRQTHRSTYSRQACAEKVWINEDGSIDQVECTSMGLNDGPLEARGTYPAAISCVLTNGHMPHCTNTILEDDIPYITNDGDERYITGITEGTTIGYKYFDFAGKTGLAICYRAEGQGKLEAYAGDDKAGEFMIDNAEDWTTAGVEIKAEGTKALYLKYTGTDRMELKEIIFS